MLTFAAHQSIYLAIEPVDIRKHFDGLWAMASEKLLKDPFSGSLFVCTNKTHDRLKILFWDGSSTSAYASMCSGSLTVQLGRVQLNDCVDFEGAMVVINSSHAHKLNPGTRRDYCNPYLAANLRRCGPNPVIRRHAANPARSSEVSPSAKFSNRLAA